MALPVNGSTHLISALLLIYRPRKDERLSWPSWLTCSGWFTHISGRPSAAGQAQDRESSPVRDRRSTTVPRHQLVIYDIVLMLQFQVSTTLSLFSLCLYLCLRCCACFCVAGVCPVNKDLHINQLLTLTSTCPMRSVGGRVPFCVVQTLSRWVDKPLRSVTRGWCDARPTVTFPAACHRRPLIGAAK